MVTPQYAVLRKRPSFLCRRCRLGTWGELEIFVDQNPRHLNETNVQQCVSSVSEFAFTTTMSCCVAWGRKVPVSSQAEVRRGWHGRYIGRSVRRVASDVT